MKIYYDDVTNSRDLAQVYNEQIRGTPYFYPVSPDEFENGIRNRINQDDNAKLQSEKLIIAKENDRIIGFAHVSTGEIMQFGQAKNGGFIHFMTYQSGYRPIGQAMLDESEKYLHSLNVHQIWAFLHASNYRFYHLGFGYLSDKIAHVLGLFFMNRYEIDLGEIFMSYPEYDIAEPILPDDKIKVMVSQDSSSGRLPSLHVEAIKNGDQIGECVTVSVGEFYCTDEVQDCFFTKWLGVEEKYQGNGLGKYLLQKTLYEMKKLGYKNAIISTNIRNYRAQLFYTNLGYKVTDTCYSLVKNI